MLVIVVQTYKNIQIEKLAENLVIPIKYESRRRRIQRWLSLKILTLSGIWHPIIKEIIKRNGSEKSRLEIILDRTQWGERNIFMVSVGWGKRSLPVSWTLLSNTTFTKSCYSSKDRANIIPSCDRYYFFL